MNWNDKTILVVGGSSGIGASVLELLSDTGAKVISLSRSKPGNPHDQHITLDITEEFSEIAGLPDTLDGIVYCPGSINLKPFQALKLSDFVADMDINFFGAVKVIQACLKVLKKSPAASVVLFSTVAVSQGMSYHAAIAAAKGAVEGLSRSLAAEYAKSGIRFNCIAPSLTDTPLAAGLLASEDKRKASDERHPLRRVGKPEDLSSAVKYLLSDESGWMTGQVLRPDGGMSSVRPL